jgi:hypothetical protein
LEEHPDGVQFGSPDANKAVLQQNVGNRSAGEMVHESNVGINRAVKLPNPTRSMVRGTGHRSDPPDLFRGEFDVKHGSGLEMTFRKQFSDCRHVFPGDAFERSIARPAKS